MAIGVLLSFRGLLSLYQYSFSIFPVRGLHSRENQKLKILRYVHVDLEFVWISFLGKEYSIRSAYNNGGKSFVSFQITVRFSDRGVEFLVLGNFFSFLANDCTLAHLPC